jgi:hypothetical protein
MNIVVLDELAWVAVISRKHHELIMEFFNMKLII